MKDKSSILKIGIALNDTITYCPPFFSMMTSAMQNMVEIHIVTNREQTQEYEAGIRKEIDELSI